MGLGRQRCSVFLLSPAPTLGHSGNASSGLASLAFSGQTLPRESNWFPIISSLCGQSVFFLLPPRSWDVVSTRSAWRDDLSGGRIIFLSTHIVSDVEATATEIVIINKGRKLQHTAPEKLLQTLEGKVWQWVVPSEMLPALKQKHIVSGVVRRQDGIQVRAVSEAAPASDAQSVAPSLEDVYLHLVSQQNGAAS
jgi:hypothetical protein